MPFEIHTLEVADSSDIQNQDKIVTYINNNVANVAGGGAGSSVSTTVSLTGYQLPTAGYCVLVTPSQAATANVTTKTTTSFVVVLTPVVATATLAAGTFDVIVLG